MLPKNPLAFRDRSVVRDSPAGIKKLAIRRGERFTELVPDTTGAPNQWRMLRPVEARADAGTVAQALTVLSSLRAEDFAAPAVGDGKAFGLDRPLMQVDWESEGSHHLKVGAAVPRTTNFYATTDAQPMVFTLPAATLRLLDAEYHDHHVMSFPVAQARRIVLRFPGRTVTLRHRPPQTRGQVEWVPEDGSDIEGIDLSRIGSLVATMSRLETLRFIQYEGEIPADTGLAHPRLKVELTLGPKDPTQVLRIGNNADDGNVCAATGTGSSGPAFFLPGPPWNELIRSGEKFPPLPDDVFAPHRPRENPESTSRPLRRSARKSPQRSAPDRRKQTDEGNEAGPRVFATLAASRDTGGVERRRRSSGDRGRSGRRFEGMGHDGRRFDCADRLCAPGVPHRSGRGSRRKRAAFLLLINLVVFSAGLAAGRGRLPAVLEPPILDSLEPPADRLGPDRGGEEVVARIPCTRSNGSEFRTEFRTNAAGYRARPEPMTADHPYRIAFVGDSFTEAMQVSYESSFCARLEGLLNRDAPRGRGSASTMGSPPPICSTTGTGSSTTC